jgi:ATP-dependent protease HslVU (ClpYQ) peptidase subunit
MTVIIGLVAHETVYIGADSLASTGCIEQEMSSPKVFRCEGQDCLIGYSGTVRMANLLHHKFVLPEHPPGMSTEKYLTTLFVDGLRATLKEAGTAAKTNEQETTTGSMLVGYRGGLYKIGYDYGLMESAASFDAVGSGEEIALGAIHATQGMDLQPRKRIRLALEAAADLCRGVRGPFVIESLPKKGHEDEQSPA